MSNKVSTSIEGLEKEIMKVLTEYKSEIDDDVKELADKNIKEASKELKAISPKAKKRVYLRKWSVQGSSSWQEPRRICKILEYC